MKKQVTLVLKQTPLCRWKRKALTQKVSTKRESTRLDICPSGADAARKRLATISISTSLKVQRETAAEKMILPELVLEGDFSRFKRLGQGMGAGTMVIRGSVGFHAGALMNGGTLVIQGNAGDWLGAQMQSGLIRVEGSAGHFVGASLPGK